MECHSKWNVMGQRHVPPSENIFMARRIDNKIENLERQIIENNINPLKLFKRFLDDLFMIFLGSTFKLHKFLEEINNIHPSIQFTMNHTSLNSELERCECEAQESIPFLDTKVQIKNGKIVTDLYRKPTDRNQYLLTNSCSPASVTKNIPFSLALRIVRICSEEEARELRFSELKALLLARSYPGLRPCGRWTDRDSAGDQSMWFPSTPGSLIYRIFTKNIGEE